MTDDSRFTKDERRRHPAVRKVFVQACVLLAPLVKGNDQTLSTSRFAMVHMVQDHFPGLSGHEAHIVIAAVERLHRENQLQTLLESQACPQKA